MRRRWPVRASAVIGLLALCAAACGTTVDVRKQRAAGIAGNGLTAAGQSDAGAGGAAGGDSGGGSSAGAGTTGGSRVAGGTNATAGGQATTATGGQAPGTGPPAPGTVRVAAPGITATKMYIGIGYSSQEAAGDKAIGVGGASPSYDARDVWNAVIKYANGHGGFAGRQLEALYYDYNLTTDTPTQDQSACAFWTQDNKVFAMLGGTDIRNECAEKAGVIPIGGGSATASTYKKFPHLVDPDTMSLSRYAVVTANGLFNAGYFTGKLGMVTWDDPEYRYTMTQGYVPTLASHGITPTDTAYIVVPQQINALGDMTSAVGNAVTKFRAEGIDHVIIQDGPAGVWKGAGLTIEWMNQAKSQQYKPRYGQNAYNAPGSPDLPADQMDQAVAIDFYDYDAKFDQGWHSNTARDACYKIEADAGLPVQSSNENDEVAAGAACDIVFMLQQVVNRLTTISADNFVHAVSGLGTSFQPAVTYGSKFAGNRDGGGQVRTEDYSAACQCLTYRGPPYYGD